MKFLINGIKSDAIGTAAPGTQYAYISSTVQGLWDGTETNRDQPVAAAMTLTDMVVRLTTAPGAGDTRVFTVMVNGSATACTVTISDTAVQNTVNGLSVSVAEGDTISMQAEATGTPADSTGAFWSIVAESVTTDYFVSFGGISSNSLSNVSATYLSPQGMHGLAEDLAIYADVPTPLSGTIDALYTDLSGTPGAGNSYTFAFMINGSASADISIAYSGTETGIKSDTGAIAITAGDTISIRSTPASTPTGRRVSFSLKVTPTTAGESWIMYGSADPPANNTTEYSIFHSRGVNWSSTQSTHYGILYATTLQAIYAKLGTAPGAGTNWVFKLREETIDLSGATVTIADAATTNNSSFSAATTTGNRYNWAAVPAGTPATLTNGAHLGVKVFFDAGGGGGGSPRTAASGRTLATGRTISVSRTVAVSRTVQGA